VSGFLSAVIDNIPYTAVTIPLVASLLARLDAGPDGQVLWWALSLGACLGGNGTLIGASANLTVAGIAERAGHPIRFLPYMRVAFGTMLVGIVISTAYVYWRYLS
jgi:Na+/H+ antiporter NhaD/arsenite permease-like protein